jgi:hypothetical protein
MQVRRDINGFISDMGFEVLDSTDTDFPADTKVHSYDACTTLVPQSDIFVLVIQGRYGGKTPKSGVSITTEEYRAAFLNHVPIFTFVHSTVWNLLQVWKKNPSGDYSPHVEDNTVFLLIDEVRKQDRNNWIWPFETAQDITNTLRNQWAALFAQMLRGARMGNFYWQASLTENATNIISAPLKLASKWSSSWEYKKKGKTVKVFDELELRQLGYYVAGSGKSTAVSGPANFKEYSYELEGKLSSDGFLEGRWHNIDPGRNYRGVFQLKARRDGKHLEGCWVGVDEQDFHTGRWSWDAK